MSGLLPLGGGVTLVIFSAISSRKKGEKNEVEEVWRWQTSRSSGGMFLERSLMLDVDGCCWWFSNGGRKHALTFPSTSPLWHLLLLLLLFFFLYLITSLPSNLPVEITTTRPSSSSSSSSASALWYRLAFFFFFIIPHTRGTAKSQREKRGERER